ncbi:hypothetical protein, partial [Flammeovirga aprica]
MMKLFKIIRKHGYQLWDMMYMEYSEEKLNLKLEENISMKNFWINPVIIPMELRGSNDAEEAGEPPIIQDYYDWSANLSYDVMSSPIANLIVISEKMRNILDQFSLPPHRYYEIEVLNVNMNQKYYVLHTLYRNEYINFKKTQFKIIDEITNEEKYPYTEVINNAEEYYKLFTTNPDLKKGLIDLVFATNYYDIKYDFLPNSPSSVYPIISENLKNALEEAKIE